MLYDQRQQLGDAIPGIVPNGRCLCSAEFAICGVGGEDDVGAPQTKAAGTAESGVEFGFSRRST
jgi:hypothetical protein